MIKTYKEEIYSRRNKNAIFRFFVFCFSCILYLFFQWFYIKLNVEIDSWNKIQTILKQFWIVNIRTNINPDNIFINWKSYNIWNKQIMDYGTYKVEIYWKKLIPVTFDILINKDYPIFFETINLFNKFQYKKFNTNFDKIYKVDDHYFVFQKNSNLIEVYDNNFILLKMFPNNFLYIGDKYFSNNWVIYYYDYYTNNIKPFSIKDWLWKIYCSNPRVINTKLFCDDSMTYIDDTNIKLENPILTINENIIKTITTIYNNSNQWNWSSYDYKNTLINDPSNIIHIDNIPLALEDGFLSYLDNSKNIKFILPEIQIIKQAIDYWDETLLLWLKWSEKLFEIISGKKRYSWNLWNINFSKLSVFKIKGVYFFNTGNNIYLYYKGSSQIFSILSWDDIKVIDNIAFFKKNWNSYYLGLAQDN